MTECTNPQLLEGLALLKPKVFKDERGFFLESFSESLLQAHGVQCSFVQDNHSCSKKGTLRGLHFQSSPGQAKLIRVPMGCIYDVAVDIRPESPTFGQWSAVYLSGENHHQLFIPVGFAHGFCVVSEEAHVMYKVSAPYDPETESGFSWNDPTVHVDWPIENPLISERDQKAPLLKDIISL